MTAPILTRLDAINAMAKGEKCQSELTCGWYATTWAHFDMTTVTKFRRPPEPRRESRVFDGVIRIQWKNGASAVNFGSDCGITLREVLPDEVCVKRMTETQMVDLVNGQITFMMPNEKRCNINGALLLARALGLLTPAPSATREGES